MSKNTPEKCEELASYIVGGMTLEELQEFVHDELYSIMLEDEEVFLFNKSHNQSCEGP